MQRIHGGLVVLVGRVGLFGSLGGGPLGGLVVGVLGKANRVAVVVMITRESNSSIEWVSESNRA